MTSALKKVALTGAFCFLSAFGAAQAAFNSTGLQDLVVGGSVNGPLTAGQYEFDNETMGINSAVQGTWAFSLAGKSAVDIFVNPSELNFMGSKFIGTSLTGTFNVTPIQMGEFVSLGVLLANTVYSIKLDGLVTGTMGGGYDGVLKVATVPVPAAVWLFGSALLGLTVFSRRRNQLANYT